MPKVKYGRRHHHYRVKSKGRSVALQDVTNTEGVDISNDVELQDVMNAEGSDISTDGDQNAV